MISYKIFFQLMITAFKENLNLQLPLIVLGLYLKQYSFQISDKFMTKFNAFSYMVLQFTYKTVWTISKPYCMTLKLVAS